MAAPSSSHSWTFFRTGGLDQVALTSGADLLGLEHLDQKLWVALSCPVKGLELDERTLALIDTDGDGRVRVPEIIAAIKWAAVRLKDAGSLLAGTDGRVGFGPRLGLLDRSRTMRPTGVALGARARAARQLRER